MPKPRRLQAVKEREGNPGKEAIPQGVRLPPEAPPEPNWREAFPLVTIGPAPGEAPPRPARLTKAASDIERATHAQVYLSWVMESFEHRQEVRGFAERRRLKAESLRARAVASRTWREIVPWLHSQQLLSRIDADQLMTYCVGTARIDQAERDITWRGLNVPGERGLVKNGSVTIANQYRDKIRPLVEAFGLTPLARDRLSPREADGPQGASPFDV